MTPDQDNPFASPAKTISVAQAVTPPPSLDDNQPIHFSGRIEDPDLTILGIRATGIAKHLGIAGIGLIGVAPMLLVFAKPIFPSIGFRYEAVAATSVVLGYVALITTAFFALPPGVKWWKDPVSGWLTDKEVHLQFNKFQINAPIWWFKYEVTDNTILVKHQKGRLSTVLLLSLIHI